MVAYAGELCVLTSRGTGLATYRRLAVGEYIRLDSTFEDSEPPTFGGLTSVVSGAKPLSVDLSWTAATDDSTAQEDIVYEVHCSKAAAQPFEVKGQVVGDTSFTMEDLLPDVTYYFRARARDESGNLSSEGSELSFVWNDAAPTFAGVSLVTALTPFTVEAQWNAGSDTITPQEALEYLVHVGTSAGDPWLTRGMSDPGAVGVAVSGLNPETTYYIRVRCRDRSGNLSADTGPELAVTTPADTTNTPRITSVSPADGSPITPTTSVSFVVTDTTAPGQPSGFRRVIITASFLRTGMTEVVHDGSGFTTLYSSQSTRTSTVGGYSYSILRYGGWPDGPQFRVYAIDRVGNEAS